MNLKKVTSRLGKKNNNEGKFIELARKKAFQKKGEPKRKFLNKPQIQKSMKPVNSDLILQFKKTYGRGAIVFKKRGREASFFLKILRLG